MEPFNHVLWDYGVLVKVLEFVFTTLIFQDHLIWLKQNASKHFWLNDTHLSGEHTVCGQITTTTALNVKHNIMTDDNDVRCLVWVVTVDRIHCFGV